jgi:hypothetical protein
VMSTNAQTDPAIALLGASQLRRISNARVLGQISPSREASWTAVVLHRFHLHGNRPDSASYIPPVLPYAFKHLRFLCYLL